MASEQVDLVVEKGGGSVRSWGRGARERLLVFRGRWLVAVSALPCQSVDG